MSGSVVDKRTLHLVLDDAVAIVSRTLDGRQLIDSLSVKIRHRTLAIFLPIIVVSFHDIDAQLST